VSFILNRFRCITILHFGALIPYNFNRMSISLCWSLKVSSVAFNFITSVLTENFCRPILTLQSESFCQSENGHNEMSLAYYNYCCSNRTVNTGGSRHLRTRRPPPSSLVFCYKYKSAMYRYSGTASSGCSKAQNLSASGGLLWPLTP